MILYVVQVIYMHVQIILLLADSYKFNSERLYRFRLIEIEKNLSDRNTLLLSDRQEENKVPKTRTRTPLEYQSIQHPRLRNNSRPN